MSGHFYAICLFRFYVKNSYNSLYYHLQSYIDIISPWYGHRYCVQRGRLEMRDLLHALQIVPLRRYYKTPTEHKALHATHEHDHCPIQWSEGEGRGLGGSVGTSCIGAPKRRNSYFPEQPAIHRRHGRSQAFANGDK